MYKSLCSCTGNEKVTVFVQSEICETHDQVFCCKEEVKPCCSSKETQQCKSHSSDCNCDKPELTYIKLIDYVVNEEVKFTKANPVIVMVAFSIVQFKLWETDEQVESGYTYIDPPPVHNSSLEFLILINQLKIPHIA